MDANYAAHESSGSTRPVSRYYHMGLLRDTVAVLTDGGVAFKREFHEGVTSRGMGFVIWSSRFIIHRATAYANEVTKRCALPRSEWNTNSLYIAQQQWPQ